MGKRAVTDTDVIDDTFVGLASPAEIHSIGRPDISEGRPGNLLVEEVARFEQEGGFKELAKEREAKRIEDLDGDRKDGASPLPDFGIRLPSSDPKEPDLSGESGDRN